MASQYNEKKSSKVEKIPEYKAELNIGGKKYYGGGDSVFTTLKSIDVPMLMKGKAILTISKAGKNVKKMFPFAQLRRIKVNDITKRTIAKYFEVFFK